MNPVTSVFSVSPSTSRYEEFNFFSLEKSVFTFFVLFNGLGFEHRKSHFKGLLPPQ